MFKSDVRDMDFNDIIKNYNPEKNLTKPLLTKYEKTVCLGIRMEQLAFGANSTLDHELLQQYNNVKDIAYEEFKQRKIPFIIKRQLPNKNIEYWRLSDLIH